MSEAKTLVRKFFDNFQDIDYITSILAEDATLFVNGQIPGCGLMVGRQAILDQWFGVIKENLKMDTITMEFKRVFEDKNTVIVESASKSFTKDGRPYNNTYTFFFEIEGNQIKAFREYPDTEYASRVLFPTSDV
ncbi:MAG: nuclear transport factor 2 family protein [Spongiibacteraceae bacterium]